MRENYQITHNIRWPSDHVIMWGHVTHRKLNISSFARSMTTKHDRLVTYAERSPPMVSHVPLTTWSHEVMWQFKNQIFLPSKDVWPPKLCNGLTYGEAKPIMKWHNSDHIIIRDHVPNWKSDISSSTKSALPELAGRWRMVAESHSWSYMPLCSLVRSHEKFKM